MYTQITVSCKVYIHMLYTSKEGNITNPLHMWVRFKTNYIYSKSDKPTQW